MNLNMLLFSVQKVCFFIENLSKAFATPGICYFNFLNESFENFGKGLGEGRDREPEKDGGGANPFNQKNSKK